jgi:X-Pro dipeptidyl-peptidase
VTVEDGVTQPVFSYADAVRETIYVQSTIDQDLDGDLDLLATDIIRPKETEGGLKVPVIYEMSPYYQATGRGNESEIKAEEDGDFTPEVFPLFYDNYFVPRGYAVVLQDMRGTRNSEGCMVLGGEEEEIDAVATINWLNGKGKAFTATGEEVTADWSTGKVGMIGKSYDGSVANGAASTGVDGLETIVPIGGISRWYDYHLNKGVQYINAYLTPE